MISALYEITQPSSYPRSRKSLKTHIEQFGRPVANCFNMTAMEQAGNIDVVRSDEGYTRPRCWLGWAGVGAFVLNIAVVGVLWSSPEVAVSMYGANRSASIAPDKPSPFAPTVEEFASGRKPKLAQKVRPVFEEALSPETSQHMVQQLDVARGTQLAIPVTSARYSGTISSPASIEVPRTSVRPASWSQGREASWSVAPNPGSAPVTEIPVRRVSQREQPPMVTN